MSHRIFEVIPFKFHCFTLFFALIPDLKRCGPPRQIKNGDFILTSKSGRLTAMYSCYHGFKLEGGVEIVCEGNQWSSEPPHCTSK